MRITVGTPFENAYCNFVAEAKRPNGESAILKIGYPASEIHTEIQALDAFNGQKSIKILERDNETCSILLEKVEPGYDLTTIKDDEEATTIAAEVMKVLPATPPTQHTLPTVTKWLDVTERIGDDHDIPRELIEKARATHHALEATKSCERVLHGDLHHENILYDEERGWLTIDPQGVIGDPICEVGAFFYNPEGISQNPNIENIFMQRATIFAETLQTNISRVIGRAFVQSVISCCWSVENNEEYDIVCVRTLEKLIDRNS